MQLDPSAAELAAGRHRKRKFGLAAEQNAASRMQAEKKYSQAAEKNTASRSCNAD